jgi:hypothetical protein
MKPDFGSFGITERHAYPSIGIVSQAAYVADEKVYRFLSVGHHYDGSFPVDCASRRF